MKQKKERFIWMGLSICLALLIVFLVLAPKLQASPQNNADEQINQYSYLFKDVMSYVHENYVDEVDPNVLFEGAMKGLFESLDDPYSVFLTNSDLRDITDTTSGDFGGVGIHITKLMPDNEKIKNSDKLPFVEVVSPIIGTPAFKAGISAGDYIIKIEGESTEPLTIEEVVKKLRGPAGTKVTVTILRGKDIKFDVTLTRAIIEIPTVKHAMIKNTKIAYIQVIQFTPYTHQRIEESIKEMEKEAYQGLIIDLRSNPGGLLDSAVKSADLFFKDGNLVSVKSRIKSETIAYDASRSRLIDKDIPICVLINKGSASASEILAGALRDRKRATLVGETTYGKGSVQRIRILPLEGGLKLTVARYYTPADINIDKIGISPDIEVKEPEMSDEELESYKKILENNRIGQFVESSKKKHTEEEIDQFIEKLKSEGLVLDERILRKLIRNEYNRSLNVPPVYDLDFDLVLQKAVEVLKEKMD